MRKREKEIVIIEKARKNTREIDLKGERKRARYNDKREILNENYPVGSAAPEGGVGAEALERGAPGHVVQPS